MINHMNSFPAIEPSLHSKSQLVMLLLLFENVLTELRFKFISIVISLSIVFFLFMVLCQGYAKLNKLNWES